MSKAATQKEFRDTPILFTGQMVRAILAGDKWQTRRLRGLKEINREPDAWHFCDLNGYGNAVFTKDERTYTEVKNPYGDEGDRLWVRETLIRCQDSELSTPLALYKAGRQQVFCNGELAEWQWRGESRPSIFMPRWASRLTLEIAQMRVERLQDITEADAKAEGVLPVPFTRAGWPAGDVHRDSYAEAWDSINKRSGFGWDMNPFVWCISFQRMES